MSKTLKLSDLIGKKACGSQVNLFKKLFGEELELTSEEQAVETALKYASKFYFVWAATRFLTVPAWEEYRKVEQLTWEEYKKVQQPAWKEYEKIERPARKEYEKVLAKTFASLWYNQ